MKQLIAKVYDNYCFDRIFLSAKSISLLEKIYYIFRKYLTIFLGRKEIVYFGKKFSFDNPFTPVLLQGYPHEINTLNDKINFNKIHSVLDVGANIGQWSFVLKSLFPHLNVISLEPNPEIFPLLQKNAKNFSGWNSYNFGLGDGDKHKVLYYHGDGSSEASVYKTKNGLNEKVVPVNLIALDKNKKLGTEIPKYFDLVKIDTEGSESEVLKSIVDISFKYLEIEVALKRNKGLSVKDVENHFVKYTSLKPKLLHLEVFNKNSPVADAIFSFVDL